MTQAHILLIEDSQTLRDLVVQILEMERYAVSVAVDGEEGLRLMHDRRPDLVLCDIAMPKMDGHQVLRATRADPATATLPFIFLTAKAERSDLRVGMDLGADDYLTKPFGADELLAAVRARLQKQESTRVAALRASEQRQSDLLVNLPHEIRTPLSGILGLAELLIEADFSAEDRRAMVNDILASGRRLERTLTNLILHMELELARHSPQKAQVFASGETGSATDAARAAVADKAREYKRIVDLSGVTEGVRVAMAGPLLRKCVEELLDNALRLSRAASPVEVVVRKSLGEVLVQVNDRGVGMTPEQIERVQAFRQLDRTQRDQQGLGLGLAIVKALVDLNRGRITVEPRTEGGVSVTLVLPQEEA